MLAIAVFILQLNEPRILLLFLQEVQEILDEKFMTFRHFSEMHYLMRNAFFTVRDEIQDRVKRFANNVKVVIVLEDFHDPIEIIIGQGENSLQITIMAHGEVSYSWKKETDKEDCVNEKSSPMVIFRILRGFEIILIMAFLISSQILFIEQILYKAMVKKGSFYQNCKIP